MLHAIRKTTRGAQRNGVYLLSTYVSDGAISPRSADPQQQAELQIFTTPSLETVKPAASMEAVAGNSRPRNSERPPPAAQPAKRAS